MGEKEKIKQYLQFKGVTKNRFYTLTGLSVGFLESGRSMGADKIKIIISRFPDININWLVLDEGEMICPAGGGDAQEKMADLLKTKNDLIELQKKQIRLLEEKLERLQDER